MMLASLVWGGPAWVLPSVLLGVAALLLASWSYWARGTAAWVRVLAGLLKLTAVTALALCLIEPLFSGMRPRPGANLFVILADNSQSLLVRDREREDSRADAMKECLSQPSDWQTRLGQDFDLRRYIFDTRVRPVADFSEVEFDGPASAPANALNSVARRLAGRPNAGILLLTDGIAADGNALVDVAPDLPPVYPVIFGSDDVASDISVRRVAVSQSNFETAPVTMLVEVESHAFRGRQVVVQLLDEAGEELQRQVFDGLEDDKPLLHRFQLRPEKPGVSFYRVRSFVDGEEEAFALPAVSSEATLVNNTRWVMVDRGRGPFRVLYVSGRPNWDFKFLRRAVNEDDEVQLVGLLRIALREPKFTFRGHRDETTNPLYRGFDNQRDEQAEQYDEPVVLRLGTEDEDELRGGFPKAADQLFRYHAIIVDDLEAEFFDQDQMSLIQRFVSQRGGGFLMLGGRESFTVGGYDRTPIGELLPVYAGRGDELEPDDEYRLLLTRDGWLQPWVRLRSTEADEKHRLGEMPPFRVFNQTRGIKPGATVLARVQGRDGEVRPALVTQRFGRGRTAAMLIGDLWRWNLRRESGVASDLEKSWRQTVRWLVSDVPGRVEVEIRRNPSQPTLPIEMAIRVRDATFEPLDNAAIEVHVTTPDEQKIDLTASASDEEVGVYLASFVPRAPGPYRAEIVATSADGSQIGQCRTGWTSDPATEEFQSLVPNRSAMEWIAEKTGGEVISAERLDEFVASLPNRKVPVTEPWIYPLWHQASIFLLAIGCLIGEWGLRRWKGMP